MHVDARRAAWLSRPAFRRACALRLWKHVDARIVRKTLEVFRPCTLVKQTGSSRSAYWARSGIARVNQRQIKSPRDSAAARRNSNVKRSYIILHELATPQPSSPCGYCTECPILRRVGALARHTQPANKNWHFFRNAIFWKFFFAGVSWKLRARGAPRIARFKKMRFWKHLILKTFFSAELEKKNRMESFFSWEGGHSWESQRQLTELSQDQLNCITKNNSEKKLEKKLGWE